MICGLGWKTATSPIECTGASNTDDQVTPLSVVRHRPPVAPATYIVYGSDSTTSMSTTRPLIDAGPMLRRRSPFRSLLVNADSACMDCACANRVCTVSAARSARRRPTAGTIPRRIRHSRVGRREGWGRVDMCPIWTANRTRAPDLRCPRGCVVHCTRGGVRRRAIGIQARRRRAAMPTSPRPADTSRIVPGSGTTLVFTATSSNATCVQQPPKPASTPLAAETDTLSTA